MKIFSYLYDKSLVWAKHQLATYYLFALSLSESIFFPIPPDVMLAPMALSQPKKAWFFAAITSIASIIGGIIGYLLGFLLFEPIVQPLIISFGWETKLNTVIEWFTEYGVWVVFIAGFSPIPYKLFTLGAGMMQMMFLPFLIASAIGRSMRFFLVAGLMRLGGEKMAVKLRNYIDKIGWATVLIIMLFLYFKS